MTKAELLKLCTGKYGQLILLAREFLQTEVIKGLADDSHISFAQFANFLKQKQMLKLLNQENLNKSFIMTVLKLN